MPNIKDYLSSGLTVYSNDKSVHQRDGAGNILLKSYDVSDTSSFVNNQNLVIEKTKFNYSVESINRVVNTRFTYFQFPVQVTADTDANELQFPNIDLSMNPFEFDNDIISGRFKIPATVDENQQSNGLRRINTSYDGATSPYRSGEDWYSSDKSGGYRRLQFDTGNHAEPGQPGSYLITADKIKYLKEKNKTIRFRIFTSFRSTRTGTNEKTSFSIKLHRREANIGWTGIFHDRLRQPVLYIDAVGDSYPGLYLEYILHPNDLYEDYRYEIQAVSGNPAWTFCDTDLWIVDMVDIPTKPPLWGNSNNLSNDGVLNYGVYDIGLNSRLENGVGSEVGIKTNEQFFYTGKFIQSTNAVQKESKELIDYLRKQYMIEYKKIEQINKPYKTQIANTSLLQKMIFTQLDLLTADKKNKNKKLQDAYVFIKDNILNNPELITLLPKVKIDLNTINSAASFLRAINRSLQSKIDYYQGLINDNVKKLNSTISVDDDLNEITLLEQQLQRLETEYTQSPTASEQKSLLALQNKTKARIAELKKKYNIK